MVQMPQNSSDLQALREFSDDDLLALMRARPDLATPPPGSLPGLLARALTRPSLERAIAALNTFQLQVLEAVTVLNHSLGMGAVSAAAVRRALGGRVAAAAVRGEIETLRSQFLLTGSDRNLRVSSTVWAALGPFPAGLGPSLEETLAQRGDLSEEDIKLWTSQLTSSKHVTELIDSGPEKVRRVLDLLTWGPPIGNRGSGEASDTSPLTWLISRGLLATAGESHVVLPREIALILRDGQTHRDVQPEPPAPDPTAPTGYRPALGSMQKFADASAGERIIEVLQLVELLISEWEDGGPTLRTGGVGVREVRRLAAALGVEENEAGFLAEITAGAQLLATRENDDAWVPSREHLVWQQLTAAEKWVQIAWSWLSSPRATWLIGQREQGQIIGPLQPGIDRAWVPRLRQSVLDVLAQTESGGVLNRDDIYAQLKWHSPRSAPHETAVTTFLDHAQWLGVLGAGALTTATRHLLEALQAGDLEAEDTAIARAVAAVETALPAQVSEVMVQGDLTIIIPGRPAANLEWLWQVARIEQRGAAQVLRLTESSVNDAMQSGWSGAEILDRLAQVAVAELPQPVEYLIADVERQFDRVRAHVASSVITTTDSASASEILADPNFEPLRFVRVAPTVLISDLPLTEVTAVLRAHGQSPVTDRAGETGARAARRRPSARGALQVGQPVSIMLDDAAPHRALMAIRAGEKQAETTGPEPLIARQRLNAMYTAGRAGWITLVDGAGKSQRRLVQVVGISQGGARLQDVERESELVVQLHRIVEVENT